MSLDRIQVVRNFTAQVVVAIALAAGAKTAYASGSAPQVTALDGLPRVGRLRVIIPGGVTVTVNDLLGGTYDVVAAAGATVVHEIPVINGHKNVSFSGTGNIKVVVLAD